MDAKGRQVVDLIRGLRLKYLVPALFALTFLMACGGDPQPTATAEPTASQAAVSTPTPTPEPTVTPTPEPADPDARADGNPDARADGNPDARADGNPDAHTHPGAAADLLANVGSHANLCDADPCHSAATTLP